MSRRKEEGTGDTSPSSSFSCSASLRVCQIDYEDVNRDEDDWEPGVPD